MKTELLSKRKYVAAMVDIMSKRRHCIYDVSDYSYLKAGNRAEEYGASMRRLHREYDMNYGLLSEDQSEFRLKNRKITASAISELVRWSRKHGYLAFKSPESKTGPIRYIFVRKKELEDGTAIAVACRNGSGRKSLAFTYNEAVAKSIDMTRKSYFCPEEIAWSLLMFKAMTKSDFDALSGVLGPNWSSKAKSALKSKFEKKGFAVLDSGS